MCSRRKAWGLFCVCGLLFCGLLGFAGSGLAQTVAGSSLSGLVRDSAGFVLPGATVEIRIAGPGVGAGPSAAAVSSHDGSFAISNLSPGRYHLRVTFPGLEPYERALIISPSTQASAIAQRPLVVVLSPEGVREQVFVQADLPTAPTLHSEVDRRLIETLPSESLSAGLSSIITLTSPGVAADSNGVFHPLGEHAETSFSIDGQPITDQQSRTFSNQLSANAIQSLDIQTGVPAAEFGDKTSLVAKAVTRSGLGVRAPTGTLSVAYGSFRSPTASFTIGAGGQRSGNFMSVDGTSSSRFLDSPEFTPLHDQGHLFNLFDRFDLRPSYETGLQLNVFAARSAFTTPNTFDQEEAGQDQRQRQWTINLAPSITRLFGSQIALEINGWARRDVVDYASSPDPLADRPAVLSQHRTLTNAGAKAALSYTHGIHAIKAGVQGSSTGLFERFHTGLTDPAFNTPCLAADGGPSGDASLGDPRDCAARGLAVALDFLPALVPYDLTRGGRLFRFEGHGRVNQWAGYIQDSLRIDPWTVTAGARFDLYRGLSGGTAVQPRLAVTYHLDRTNTILRAAYGHIFLTPYNENLVLASSTGAGGFGGGILGSVGGAPLTPATRHQYGIGVQQNVWRGIRVDTEYFWKFTDGAYDFDVILNTPLTFPVQFRKSRIDGGLMRVTLPPIHGWQIYTTLSHSTALLFGPPLGGLRFSADYAPIARPDHDQPFQATTHLEYHTKDDAGRLGRLGYWAGVTWRYDHGLVAVAVPTYADALRLTGDEQAVMGLYCGSVFATRDHPLRSCSAPTFGATRIKIPAPGTGDNATNPPRITPRQLVDLSTGLDKVTVGRVPLRIRLTVVNLFNTVALYNFLSTFSGTHFVTPRAGQVQLTIRF